MGPIGIPAWYDEAVTSTSAATVEGRTANVFNEGRVLRRTKTFIIWFSARSVDLPHLGCRSRPSSRLLHPTDVSVTGFDIIFFWGQKWMIMLTMHLVKNRRRSPRRSRSRPSMFTACA